MYEYRVLVIVILCMNLLIFGDLLLKLLTSNTKGLGEIIYYFNLVNKEGQETLGSESQ